MLLERWVDREWDWLADLGSHGPWGMRGVEPCLHTVGCLWIPGWHQETLMLAHTTLRGAIPPPGPNAYMRLSVFCRASDVRVSYLPISSSPGTIRVSTDTP